MGVAPGLHHAAPEAQRAKRRKGNLLSYWVEGEKRSPNWDMEVLIMNSRIT